MRGHPERGGASAEVTDLAHRISMALGSEVVASTTLAGGCISDVRRLDLADGRTVVAKIGGGSAPSLEIEAFMLRYLAENSSLPVPDVLLTETDLLVMTHLESSGALSAPSQDDAAVHVAALHEVRGTQFGLERDTLIGPLHQPNAASENWVTFFREHRLLYTAREAGESGRLPLDVHRRIEKLASKLDNLISEPAHPSLLHGDLWTGNVLVAQDRISGFVDPAIYYGHAEMDLAFSTLFGTFGNAFFQRYQQHRPLEPGFFEARRDIYNLYPLLVHVRLFGGSYASQVDQIVRRFV